MFMPQDVTPSDLRASTKPPPCTDSMSSMPITVTFAMVLLPIAAVESTHATPGHDDRPRGAHVRHGLGGGRAAARARRPALPARALRRTGGGRLARPRSRSGGDAGGRTRLASHRHGALLPPRRRSRG